MVRLRPLLFAAVCVAGCDDRAAPLAVPWVPEAVADLGPEVARVGEVPIFTSEVAAQASRTGKSPRAALDDLVAFHLLAEQLRAEWPPTDASSREERARILVQRFMERNFEPVTRLEDMPDAEVRKLYDAAKDKFVHPRLVEVAVLSITPGKRAGAEVREAARKTMLDVKVALDARKERTPADMQTLASEPKWRDRRLQFFQFLQAHDQPYTAKFGAVVEKMKPGETSAVISDEYGFYIARYVSERPPQNTKFEEVRDQLRQGHYARWRQEKFLELIQQVASRHEVEIHPVRLGGQAMGRSGS